MWQPVSPTQVLTNMLSREHSNDSFRRSTQFSGALANLRAAVPNRSQRATSIFAGSHSHFSHLDVLLLQPEKVIIINFVTTIHVYFLLLIGFFLGHQQKKTDCAQFKQVDRFGVKSCANYRSPLSAARIVTRHSSYSICCCFVRPLYVHYQSAMAILLKELEKYIYRLWVARVFSLKLKQLNSACLRSD